MPRNWRSLYRNARGDEIKIEEYFDWWHRLLAEYEADGIRDFDAGIFDAPYPNPSDPIEEASNIAYKRGYDRRRKETTNVHS